MNEMSFVANDHRSNSGPFFLFTQQMARLGNATFYLETNNGITFYYAYGFKNAFCTFGEYYKNNIKGSKPKQRKQR